LLSGYLLPLKSRYYFQHHYPGSSYSFRFYGLGPLTSSNSKLTSAAINLKIFGTTPWMRDRPFAIPCTTYTAQPLVIGCHSFYK
jgi:hypothetical protein